MPISVFLISNYRLVLCSLADLITSKAPGFMLAGTANSLTQALELAPEITADVVLLDIDSGTDCVLTLINALHAASHTKILLLTRMQEPWRPEQRKRPWQPGLSLRASFFVIEAAGRSDPWPRTSWTATLRSQ